MFPKVVFAFIPLLPFIGVRQSVSGSGSKIIESRSSATWYGWIRHKRPVDCDLRTCPRALANQCAGGIASLRQSPLTDRPPCQPFSGDQLPLLGQAERRQSPLPIGLNHLRCFREMRRRRRRSPPSLEVWLPGFLSPLS